MSDTTLPAGETKPIEVVTGPQLLNRVNGLEAVLKQTIVEQAARITALEAHSKRICGFLHWSFPGHFGGE